MQSEKPSLADQQQSPLFRFPRELRDEVYYYYASDEKGYSHNPTSATLKTSDGDAIDLGLQLTCKKIAKEMEGLSLRMNNITFRATCERLLNASLYQQLLDDHGCPASLAVQRMMEKAIEKGYGLMRSGYLHNVYTLDNYNDESILLDLVRVMTTHPAFYRLTSREYDLEARRSLSVEDESDSDSENEGYQDPVKPPCYSRETQLDILRWRPRLWWIPDRIGLDAVMQFLSPWLTTSPRLVPSARRMPSVYFSATASAIKFIEELNPETQKHLRKIIIQEDCPSVASSKTHAQGLIPLVRPSKPYIRVARAINASIATWINEVKILCRMGMPIGSFTLVLHGPSEHASQQLSDTVLRAAIWHEGAVEVARREGRNFLYYREGIAEDFVDVIKEMLRREIPVRFEAEMDEVWDIEKILREHIGDWPREVGEVFRLEDFDEPDGG
ncbi:hypothetical protein G6011_04171 [Alternaria panax]|uniref:Uncharacterized protein n=1 Tax=Alternaria panax TaxID=48097 RepID=A0AAD4NS98_9PLEO|nr:hypothetical protein G6011_04171 [Alternaria panax]